MNTPPYGAIAAAAVALAGLVLLVLGGTATVRVPTAWYRYGSGVALAALVAWAFSGGTLSGPDESTPLGKVVSIGLELMVFTPFLLVVELGGTGYLGFKGRLRYVGLALMLLGVVALAATLVGLFWIRLKEGAWH
jgi:hypothetical protein